MKDNVYNMTDDEKLTKAIGAVAIDSSLMIDDSLADTDLSELLDTESRNIFTEYNDIHKGNEIEPVEPVIPVMPVEPIAKEIVAEPVEPVTPISAIPMSVQDEPSLDEQYKNQQAILEHRKAYLRKKVLESQNIVIDDNDPLMLVYLTNLGVLMDVARDVSRESQKQMDKYKDELFTHIEKEIQRGSAFIARERFESNKAFEKNLDELRALTKETNDRRDELIAEITYRLEYGIDKKINDSIHERLKQFTDIMDKNFNTLAKNANVQVNNERVMSKGRLQGAILGLFIGVVVMVIMVIVLKR